AHDSAEGGLAVALAESCISGGLGAEIEVPSEGIRWDELLFSEGGARIVVSVRSQDQQTWESYLQAQTFSWELLGRVSGQGTFTLTANDQRLLSVSLAEMTDCWSHAIEKKLND
ncbi:MAG: AIR synthase-related protein, partial [Thermosynechococcaceae cyanobacterium]